MSKIIYVKAEKEFVIKTYARIPEADWHPHQQATIAEYLLNLEGFTMYTEKASYPKCENT